MTGCIFILIIYVKCQNELFGINSKIFLSVMDKNNGYKRYIVLHVLF